MFMHIVTHLSGRITALYIQVYTLIKARLLKLANSLRVNSIRVYQNAVNLLSPFAKTLSKTKALLASLTTQVLSIKQGLKLVVTTSGQIGQLLLTTVRQIRQHVAQAFKKDQ